MDIGALSIGLSNAKLGNAVSIALTKKIMDTAKVNANNMNEILKNTAQPHLGGNIDTTA